MFLSQPAPVLEEETYELVAKLNKLTYIWVSTREVMSSGFATRSCSNKPAQLQRLARKLKFDLKQGLGMILSNKRITKVLTRLCGCAGWSAPLLFADSEDRFSHV